MARGRSRVRRALRQGAERLPGFLKAPLRRLRVALDPQARRTGRQEREELAEFARRYQELLHDPTPVPASGRTLLVATSGMSSAVQLEMVLVKSLQMAGFDPVVLGGRENRAARYYALWGMKRYLCWEDLFPFEDPTRELPPLESFEDVVGFSHAGSRVGKYAASWVMRRLRVSSLDPRDAEVWEVLVDHLRQGAQYAHAAREALRLVRPQAALFIEHGYSPWGELFDQCIEAGVDTLQWNGCHKDNALMLKRYSRRNAHMHPASLSEDSWRRALSMPWGAEQATRLERELHDNYSSGQWFGEVGTQFHKRIYDRRELESRLGIDPSKKTAVVFAHMFWDATFFYGRDLFRDYQDWFVETLRVAFSNPGLNWLVKIHPANVVKNRRDGFAGELSEKAVIRRHLGEPPPHVRLIEPESDISTYSLFSLMDYCLTVRGTIGVEAASFGIPVLTAGTGRYDRLGFTIDHETAEEYLARVRRLHELPSLTPEQRQRAQRYAYAVFVKRPWPIESVRLEYARDATATASVAIRAGSLRELAAAPDLRAFTHWVLDGQAEDFWAEVYPARRPP